MAFCRDLTLDEIRDQRIADLETQVRNLTEIVEAVMRDSVLPGRVRVERDAISGGIRLVK